MNVADPARVPLHVCTCARSAVNETAGWMFARRKLNGTRREGEEMGARAQVARMLHQTYHRRGVVPRVAMPQELPGRMPNSSDQRYIGARCAVPTDPRGQSWCNGNFQDKPCSLFFFSCISEMQRLVFKPSSNRLFQTRNEMNFILFIRSCPAPVCYMSKGSGLIFTMFAILSRRVCLGKQLLRISDAYTSFHWPSLDSILTSRFSSILRLPASRIAVVATVFLSVGRPFASRSFGVNDFEFTARQPSTNFSSEI